MALTAIERKRIEDAVQTLATYNKNPFISDFLRKQPKPRIPIAKYEKAELCDLIRQILLGEYRGRKNYSLDLEDLISYLDSLQETGRQHLYLFSFPEDERESILDSFREEKHLKRLIKSDDALYGEGKLVWETSDGPELAHIRYDGSTQGRQPRRLILKWVETRVYWAPEQSKQASELEDAAEIPDDIEVQEIQAEETKRIQIKVKYEERAVAFFVVNLDTSRCELRIQSLHGRSRTERQNQLNKYRALIKLLLGFELVGPTVLAPAVRQALTTREVPILACSAILPNGGRFTGGRDQLPPVDVRRLQAGVTIRFEWKQKGAGVSTIELDGRLDEILINRPLLPEQHELVVEKVRLWRRDGLTATTLVDVHQAAQSEVGPEVLAPEQTFEIDAPILPITRDDWVSIVKTALRDRRIEELNTFVTQPAIDQAILEYVRTHSIEEREAVEKGSGEGKLDVKLSAAVIEDPRPLEQFLNYIKEVAQGERLGYQREIKLIRSEELWYSRLSIAAAVLALIIVTIGAFLLIFMPGKLTIGTITAVLGIVTGRGSVLIRSYAKSLKARRELVQEQQRDSQQTLLAIQTALSIPDPRTRSDAMTSAATTLLARVTGLTPQVQPSKS